MNVFYLTHELHKRHVAFMKEKRNMYKIVTEKIM